MGNSHRKNTPRKDKIRQYWIENGLKRGLDASRYDNACEKDICVCCGLKSSKLQKAHIIPNSRGGNEDVSNLILLCGRCHRESPDIADENILIEWMNEQPSEILRLINMIQPEAEKYADDITLIDDHISHQQKLREAFRVEYKKAETHGRRFSDSTRIYVIRNVLKSIFS